MPHLVLFDDAGGELFRGPVAQEHVDAVAGFLRRHIKELRGIAKMVQAYRVSVAQLDEILGVSPARARRRPRRGRA